MARGGVTKNMKRLTCMLILFAMILSGCTDKTMVEDTDKRN